MKYIYTAILLFFVVFDGSAQTFLTGKVRMRGSSDTLVSVSIENHTQRKYDLSDEAGSYRIPARPGDMLTFSSVGYFVDSVTVSESMLSGDCPIFLIPRPVTLRSVRIGSLANYQADSAARRELYKWVYNHVDEKLVEKERKGDGVGVNIALFRNGSRADKEREVLKKRLVREEQDHYIDFRYSKEYVSRLTHLQGDSLKKFMQLYRPTYEYVRSASTVDILVFVNDGIRKFRPSGSDSLGVPIAPKPQNPADTSNTPESR
ncbi:MAG: hypothetical protein P4L51_01275 [Puia sp.]|nr:hypothetical protein [Puia sp.]